MHRFLVLFTLFYVLGIILGRYCFTLTTSIFLFIGTLACALFNLFSKKEGLQALIPFMLLFLATGSLALHFSLHKVTGNLRNFAGEKCTLIGMVEGEPLWLETEVVFPLCSEKIILKGKEHPVDGTARVTLRLDNDGNSRNRDNERRGEEVEQDRDKDHTAAFLSLSYGQEISLQGILYEPKERRNPGGFDYRAYLETQGIAAVFYGQASNLALLGLSPRLSPFQRAAFAAREKMSGVLRAYLPPKEGSLLVGMLFGERKALAPDTERIFRASGVSHLLAVSGLHVGLIAVFIFWAAKKAGLKGWQAFVFFSLLLFAYVYICGLKPATLRAFIMILMAMGAVQLGRSNDLPTALAAAALVILIYNPLLLFTAGFQLSYAATLSIIMFIPALTEKISLLGNRMLFFLSPAAIKTISSLAAVTLAAQLGVVPLTAYYFKEISLVALFSNMLILPVISLVLGVGLAAALLGLFFPTAASILNLANYPLLTYISLITEKVSSLPFAYREVYPPRFPELIIYYTLLLFSGLGFKQFLPFILRLRQRLRPFHVLVFILLLALVCTWWGLPGSSPKKLEIVFLDVGQGDAIFVHTPLGHNILIDSGGNPAFRGNIDEPGRYVVVPFLEYRRIKKLDLVIVSHPHEDHYGGLLAVLDKFPVEVLAINADIAESPLYQNFLHLAEKKGISWEIVEKGDKFKLGADMELNILSPPSQLFSGTSSDANNNSLVIHLRYKKAGALFTGDIETEAAEYLLEERLLTKCQVIKIPHHGGYLENLPELLDQVSPSIAVISVGANSFGHPHPATISALQEKNVLIYRTDLHGAVTIKTDGYSWEAQQYLKLQPDMSARRVSVKLSPPYLSLIIVR